MSIIASLADLFRRSAVPSVEATLVQTLERLGPGGARERAIENLRNLLGEGVSVSQQTIGTALSRIQTALQRGAAIERGETVPRQLIPVDPTLPIGTEFRYRVAIEASIPGFPPGSPPQFVTTVIPVDSERELTKQEIAEMIQPALELLARQSGSPRFMQMNDILTTQQSEITNVTVISVYRSPVG